MKLYQNKNWLYQKYAIEKLSPREISLQANCGRRTISNWLLKHDISLRTASEATKLASKNISRKYQYINNRDWLYQKYIVDGLSTIEIAKIVGAKTGNSVRQSLIRNSIPIRNRSDAQTHKRKSDGFVLNLPVIEGCLLGDGSLRVNNKNNALCKASFHKKNINYDHVLFVASELFEKPPISRIKKSKSRIGNKTYEHFTLSSLKYKSLKFIYDRWYPKWNDYKKAIPENLYVSSKLLLHMFLDDGSSFQRRKNSSTKQISIVISTQCFSRDNQEMFAEKVKNKFNCKMTVTPTGDGTGWRIQLPQSQVGLFYEIIGPPPVKSLAYKWK